MTDVLQMWTNHDRHERLEVIRSRFTAGVQFHERDGLPAWDGTLAMRCTPSSVSLPPGNDRYSPPSRI